MKKVICVAVYSFILCFPSILSGQDTNSQKTLTFEDALLITKKNNLLMKQADEKTKQMEREKKAAKGLYFPKISVNASYVFMSDDIDLDLNPVKDAITPLYEALGNYGDFSGVPNPDPTTSGSMPYLPDDVSTDIVRQQFLDGLNQIESQDWNKTIQKKQFGTISAGFTLPIYTGGKIQTANKAASIKTEEANIEHKLKLDQLSCELIERYYGLVLVKQAQKIREEVEKTMYSHLTDADKMMKEGVIPKAEFLHAKVYHSDALRELKKINRKAVILNDALLNTLAVNEETSIVPVSNLFYIDNLKPLDYFLDKALENSQILYKIEKKKELSRQAYKLEKAEFFPNVAAMGTYNLYNQDLSPYIPDYAVGIGMKLNLFTGNERYNKLKAAKHKENQAELLYGKVEQDIKTAITKYYQELHMNLEQLKELSSALEFALEYARVREQAFKEGMATTTEVSDANLAVAKVKIDRLRVLYDYDVALSKLLYYSGITDEFVQYTLSDQSVFESL